MNLNNEVILEKEIEKLNYKVGGINKDINILNKKALDEVISNLDEDYTDVLIRMGKSLYVVEISTCDNEKDIGIYKAYDYFAKYGNLEDWIDTDSISQEEYESFKKLGL